ncbi:hypothetical protein BDR03DRAFT_977569 [Suillus americanus]|nr:hypothetical protein BDR03DRAFT_977569 [Suillus americanus]
MPPTPHGNALVSTTTTMVAPAEPAEDSTTIITPETREEAILLSKELIVSIFFTINALVSCGDDKKCIVKSIITQVRPRIPALLIATQWTADDKDVMRVWNAMTKFHTGFATIICQAVMMGYSLFPPQGCNIPPDTFRVDQVQCLVVDNPLVFMHQYSFAADGTLVIHTKFNNQFILHILTQFIWCSTFQLHTFLDKSLRRQLDYAISVAGAMTESVLIEQGKLHLATGKITPQMTFSTFSKILSNLNGLGVAEQAIIDEFKDSIVICGRSQEHANDALSDFSFE